MTLLAVNGERVLVHDVPPSSRLIEVLRTATRFKGPKLACGEGGCGACAVLCQRYNPTTGAVSRCSLNACLAPVGSLDGCAVTTAEGLGDSRKGFHPVQDALARNFASQCGFCTPGITVALAAAAAADAAGDDKGDGCQEGNSSGSGSSKPAAVALARGLDGNLCRCTGWRPIIDTCRELADMEDLCSSSSSSCSSKPGCCKASPDSTTPGTPAQLTCPTQLPAFPAWLKQYVAAKHQQHQQQHQQLLLPAAPHGCSPPPAHSSAAWQYSSSGSSSGLYGAGAGHLSQQAVSSPCQVWLSPVSLQQLAAMVLHFRGTAHLLAGNTGSGVHKELWPHASPAVITTHSVAEMVAVTHHTHGVMLGGANTLQQLLQVLRAPAAAAASARQKGSGQQGWSCSAPSSSSSSRGGGCAPASTAKAWGAMADHIERIAGVHVRSAATLRWMQPSTPCWPCGSSLQRPRPQRPCQHQHPQQRRSFLALLPSAGPQLPWLPSSTCPCTVHPLQQQQWLPSAAAPLLPPPSCNWRSCRPSSSSCWTSSSSCSCGCRQRWPAWWRWAEPGLASASV